MEHAAECELQRGNCNPRYGVPAPPRAAERPGGGPGDSVLLRYPGRISRFSFQLDKHSIDRVADWLIALCNRGVESIDLHGSVFAGPPYSLHSSVFFCTQLVYLQLHYCNIPPLPAGFTGFPVLEELKLNAAIFPENGESQLEAILGASPLLNTLSLSFVDIRGDGSDEWVIGGPNLRSLTIICVASYGWRIADMPCLDEVTIDLPNYVSGDFEGFIARFAQVRKLNLNMQDPLPPLTNGHLMETLPCTFNNLKCLILRTHFCKGPTVVSTFCLLMNAPNLEELDITIYRDVDETEANAVYQNTQLTDAFCASLHVVTIDGISWLPNEMYFIELVLSKAMVLLTMHLELGYYKCSKSNEDALCELMTYRRVSPHAQVFFNDKLLNGDVSFASCWE